MRDYTIFFCMVTMLLAGPSNALGLKLSELNPTVSVNVHGVNYTEDPFAYIVIDQKNSSNRAGGEHVSPYSGGGIMCCFNLPKRWAPQLKVNIQVTYWLKKNGEDQLQEVKKLYVVDVPHYTTGRTGELWVLRTAGGGVEIVMSEVEPGNAEWPGKIKGWPRPSLSFQRERWDIDRKQAEINVSVYQDGLKELNSSTEIDMSEEWDLDMKYHTRDVKVFSGPNDAAYLDYKRKIYTEGLKRSKARLDQLLKNKP